MLETLEIIRNDPALVKTFIFGAFHIAYIVIVGDFILTEVAKEIQNEIKKGEN